MTTTPPEPGTLVFCHGAGIISKAIRLGEWLRYRDGHFWNHVAILDDEECPVHHCPYVIQAVGAGVTDDGCLDTIAPGGSYELVAPPQGVSADDVLTFAQDQVGQEYGWISIVSIIFRILLPKWVPLPTIRSRSTWICSALAGEALRFAGWYEDWTSIYTVVPSELYAAIHDVDVLDLYKASE
jgi:hypothetical protein